MPSLWGKRQEWERNGGEKELVSFWWLSLFDLPMSFAHCLICQETEALGLGSWWITAVLTLHELPTITQQGNTIKEGHTVLRAPRYHLPSCSTSERKCGWNNACFPHQAHCTQPSIIQEQVFRLRTYLDMIRNFTKGIFCHVLGFSEST